MMSSRRIFYIIVAALLCVGTHLLAFPLTPMLTGGSGGGGAGGVPTGVSPLSASVADNVAANTVVATLGCTTSDGSNNGCTFAVTDPQGYLKVVGNTLETTGAAMTDGTYSNILLQATKNGVTYPAGTVACTIGKPYQGTVPAGAHAAGFDTCAYNMDVSQFTTLSQFLGSSSSSGCTASLPVAFGGVAGLPLDCSEFSLVTDNGVPALRLHVPAGTVITSPGNVNVSVNPVDFANATAGQIFPMTRYLELRARWGPGGITGCGSTGCDLDGAFTFRTSPDPGGSIPSMEIDDWECYAPSSTQSQHTNCEQTLHPGNATLGSMPSGAAGFNATGFAYSGRTYFPVDVNAWHTFGFRMVSDGAANLAGTTPGNMSWCTYVDGVQKFCAFGTYFNNCSGGCAQDLFQFREYMTTSVQPVFLNETVPVDIDLFVSRITYWECSAWQAATPLTRNGNNCLNSTAAVTGALTGAP